jgi:ribose 5-phosphate isomerase B
MQILFASDHAGVDLKQLLIERAGSLGHDAIDLGTHGSASVDYSAFAHELASQLLAGGASFGVLICGTGIGMSMAANRHRGIRAALCHDAFTAEITRRHNDANVLCLGGRTTGPGVAIQMFEIFLATPFEGGRHQKRVDNIEVGQGTGNRGPGTDPPAQSDE